MPAIRENIFANEKVAEKFIRGVFELKREKSGWFTTQFGITGPKRSISTYDLFVIWRHIALTTFVPAGDASMRTAASRGPSFLPWHRMMLLTFEQNLRRVMGEAKFGIPYWDWAADGDAPCAAQPHSAVWKDQCMGERGAPLATGPFASNPEDARSWQVRVEVSPRGVLRSVRRGLRRSLNVSATCSLPKTSHVQTVFQISRPDGGNWDTTGVGMRNHLEGWTSPTTPWLTNRVHIWIGGDMCTTTAPNDPVFYLVYSNLDRIWERWLRRFGRRYEPNARAGGELHGYRLTDRLMSPFGQAATPRSMLNLSNYYRYDELG